MINFKKLAAAAVSVTLSATLFGCSTPAIGSNTKSALTVDGYDVPAGLFIYYTLQGYSEAAAKLQTGSDSLKPDDVKGKQIGSDDATEWIQNKATEYCVDFVSIMREFEAINGELSAEDKEQAAQMAEYYYSSDARLEENGVSLDTMKLMAENSYKEQEVFKHYYGFDGEKGCSEEELKDYFDDNFARVKYVSISLLDSEGNKLSDDEQRTLRKKAEDYAKQINSKSKELDKMLEVDAVQEDYTKYQEEQAAAAETTTSALAPTVNETTTTTVAETTTTTTEEGTTTTTTTDPYANEVLMQKNTTTTKAADAETDTETTTAAAEDVTQSDDYKFKEFLFNDIKKDTATVYDYNEDTIYVVIRGDLRERMTEDGYWTENYIQNLQSMRYYEDFTKFLDDKAKSLDYNKNSAAYRRYDPFKLKLEDEKNK